MCINLQETKMLIWFLKICFYFQEKKNDENLYYSFLSYACKMFSQRSGKELFEDVHFLSIILLHFQQCNQILSWFWSHRVFWFAEILLFLMSLHIMSHWSVWSIEVFEVWTLFLLAYCIFLKVLFKTLFRSYKHCWTSSRL